MAAKGEAFRLQPMAPKPKPTTKPATTAQPVKTTAKPASKTKSTKEPATVSSIPKESAAAHAAFHKYAISIQPTGSKMLKKELVQIIRDANEEFGFLDDNSFSSFVVGFLIINLPRAFEVSDLIIQLFKNARLPINTSSLAGINSCQF